MFSRLVTNPLDITENLIILDYFYTNTYTSKGF